MVEVKSVEVKSVEVRSVVVVGEAMVELDEVQPRQLVRRFGGDTFNTAVHLVRERPTLPVRYLTAVGDDRFSRELLALAADEGIDVTGVRVVPGGVLGAYLIATDPEGERTFTYWRGQSPARQMFDERAALAMPSADTVEVLVLSGITLAIVGERGRRMLADLAAEVARGGASVVYDPNHRSSLWPDDVASHWLRQMCALGSIVLASVDDGRSLASPTVDAVAFATTLRESGAREVVVTAGRHPAVVSWDEQLVSIDACSVDVVVDTTGAGDAFDAAYLAARLRGADPAASVIAGHRRAAVTVAHRGAISERNPQ